MVFTDVIQVNPKKNEQKKRSNRSTDKVPTSKVENNPDWDKRMLGIIFRKVTGKCVVYPIDFI